MRTAPFAEGGNEMSSSIMKKEFLETIVDNIQDGIIVMNGNRIILSMNLAARDLTGWRLGDRVPFCTFCEEREVPKDEGRCLLIARDKMPYFLSEMLIYQGQKIKVEMSTAQMVIDEKTGEAHYLLVLRDQTFRRKEEEARLSKIMIKRLTEAQEKEHKRLAQELHDGIGQSLYSASIAMDNIQVYVQKSMLKGYIDEVREELNQAIADIKSYSQQLRPIILDQLGLISTIESLVDSLMKQRPDIKIYFETNVNWMLPAEVESNLYRVIQEALHNMMKYAAASTVEIKIIYEEKDLEIGVYYTDNGVGFDVEVENKGLGLQHMSERIDQIGGSFSLTSKKGEGTTIAIRCPMEEGGIHD